MQKALVIGGSGFLGQALVRGLQQAGVTGVHSLDLSPHPDPNVESFVGDMRIPDQIAPAFMGVDTVFHTAALVDWGPRSRERLFAVNVQGTRNVIAACQAQGISQLVFTSSIDVVFDGRPIRNGDESLPYPRRHLDDYGHTKALSEQDVLQANTARGLQTCSLRAAGIYGPGDRHRFPSVFKAVREGKMVRLGDGSARFNHIYITNLVEAHLKAAAVLQPGSPASGQAYFVTDHQPGNFYDFFTPYFQALGFPPPRTSIPAPVAYALAVIMETMGRLGMGPQPPLLTRYVVLSTCRDFYFSGEKARRDLGYVPPVSEAQAFEETLAWAKTLAA